MFPALIPEEEYKGITSTSEPSTRHALVVDAPEVVVTSRVLNHLKQFFEDNSHIDPTHGLAHAKAVYEHANRACCNADITAVETMEVLIAALLHDVDDRKYFPSQQHTYENAWRILAAAGVPEASWDNILFMIDAVSCSKNGNHVPDRVA